jgi:signal transduction histidine kinase
LAPAGRTAEQVRSLSTSLAQFWDAVDRVFALAGSGREKDARAQIQLSLQARQAALSTTVARFLVQNSENEEQAAQRIIQIYDRVQRQVYVFLAATLGAILLTGFSMIRWNRRLFARMAELSERRSELAQKLIATQESTLRYISRELHDEFGQILTAMGAMLGRAGAHAPEGSSLRTDLQEVRQIAQDTLDRVEACRRRCIRLCWMRRGWRARSTGTFQPWNDRPELPYPMKSRACRSRSMPVRQYKSTACCRKH